MKSLLLGLALLFSVSSFSSELTEAEMREIKNTKVQVKITDHKGEVVFSEEMTQGEWESDTRDWNKVLINSGVSVTAVLAGGTGMQIAGHFVGIAGTAVSAAIGTSLIATLGFAVSAGSIGYGIGSGIVAIDEALFKGTGIEFVADYGVAPVVRLSEEAKDLYDYYKTFMNYTFSQGDL
jgi:hypothetical protein